MSEKKETKKKFSRVSISVIVSLIAILIITNAWSYMSFSNDKKNLQDQLNSLNTTYQNYVSTHSHGDSEYDSLNTIYQNYMATHSHSNSDYDLLNAAYQNYMAAHSHTNSEYDSLNASYQNYIASHSHLDSDYNAILTERNQLQDWLNGNITYLTSQINTLNTQITDLNSIVNLQKFTIWVNHVTVSQPANSYTLWTRLASYAGYVRVYVESSTTSNTYASVEYISHGVNYDVTITVGSSGTAVFPVLPGTVYVYVGNTNLLSGATETVTITYYY